MQVFLQLLQVACKFSASPGVHTTTIQLQCKKQILVLQLYWSCIALVWTTLMMMMVMVITAGLCDG